MNGKLGSGSGHLATANIRDHCTSGVVPKSDVQDFSLKVRKVLFSDIQVIKQVGCIPPHYGELHRAAVVR
jgi:hypothetical protein